MSTAARQLSLFSDESIEPGRVPGFSVRQSSRARRLSIKVYPRGRVEVVVPRRTSARTVREFVEENREWIGRARESFAEHYTPESFRLPSVIRLPSIGLEAIVRYQPVAGSSGIRIRYANGMLDLRGNTADNTACLAALKRWLAGLARKEFEPRLRDLARLTATPFEKMHVRMQRTCWGSRSSSGTISLNLCLLFLEPELLRYLMIHELCHGRHMNHSRRFWKLVGSFCPDYRSLDKRLGESWRDVPAWLGIY